MSKRDLYPGLNSRWPVRTLEERFFSHVSPEPNSGCSLWTAAVDSRTGYALFAPYGTCVKRAHHVAFFIATGRWPILGLDLCHKCDARICVRFEHLFEGTRSDNMQDASRKGRIVIPNAKLTAEDAIEIRRRLAAGARGIDLAPEFHVTESAITKCKQGWTPKFGPKIGRSWKSV